MDRRRARHARATGRGRGAVRGWRRGAGLLVAMLVAGGLALLAPLPAHAADVVVNSLADTTTACSATGTRCLREAIVQAGTGGTITFSVTGTITLGRGTLVVANPVTIAGPGAALLVIDALGAVRVISVPATGSTAISGLTVTGGNNPSTGGGGIYAGHTLTLTGVVVRGNTASGAAPGGQGGGIYVDTGGTLVLDGSTVGGPNAADANTANGNGGGGIYASFDASVVLRNASVVRGNRANGQGGGLWVSGPVASTGTSSTAITGSTIAGNTAGGFGGGLSVGGPLTLDASTVGGAGAADANQAANAGGIFVNGGGAMRTLRNGATVRGNRATNQGGGIWASGPLTITGGTVAGNVAGTDGGGIYTFYRPPVVVEGSTIGGPNAADANQAASGGGIYIADSGPLVVRGSVIRGNAAASNGGGLYNSGGSFAIRDSAVRDNRTVRPSSVGGGLVNYGTTEITGSTISGNGAARGGGGVANESGGTLNAGNVTISGNTAQGVSGGGGIGNALGGTATLRNVTVAYNAAPATSFGGGGVRNAGTLTIGNSLLTANTSNASGSADYYQDGTATSEGYNYISRPSANFAAVGTDTLLDSSVVLPPLADNGGAVALPDGTHPQTHALIAGSVPIDAGSDALCASPLVGNRDQRGVIRPQGARCDIGAFEAELVPAPAPRPVGEPVGQPAPVVPPRAAADLAPGMPAPLPAPMRR